MSQRITSTASTILLAFGMAILVWIVALREENPTTVGIYQQRITLAVIPPTEGLIITNKDDIPSNIQVRLTAPRSSWQRLSPNKFTARLDLSAYSVGEHNVPIVVTVSDQQVEVEEAIPLAIKVILESLETKQLPLIVRLSGEPPGGFVYRLPRETISMTIKGPAGAVKDVERVEAQVFLNNARETVERIVRPLPKNITNETVSDVIVEPARPTISIVVEQKFGYANVPVKASWMGVPATGYFIASILTEPPEVVLRGLDDAPSLLETGEIDVSGATGDIVKRVPLDLPPGFSVEVGEGDDPENSRSVLVTVKVSAFTGGFSVERNLTVQGVGPDLEWVADPETVEILLRGPVPLLQDLTEEDVTVIVDLFELEPGVHRLVPTVIKPEELAVGSILPDTVEVTINPKEQPQILPTSSPVIVPTTMTTTTDTIVTDSITVTTLLTGTSVITEAGLDAKNK